jgi:cyanophycinase
MTSVHLLGGGWDPAAAPALYGPFLRSAGEGAAIATVVLDEGDGLEQFGRWDEVLRRTAACTPVPVLVPAGGRLDVTALGDAAGLLVCGGLTPAYAEALAPVAADVREWLAAGSRPYAGFSAGAAVAAGQAVVGGWRSDGVTVCPEDAAEDLEEVTLTAGLGLVPWPVDVHCAQWGTLPRLVEAVARASSGTGIALDEGTALHLGPAGATVDGTGSAHCVVTAGTGAVTLTTVRRGGVLPAALLAAAAGQPARVTAPGESQDRSGASSP